MPYSLPVLLKLLQTIFYSVFNTVSHESDYTPYMSANILVHFLKGQYYRNETWMDFTVVNVLLV